MNAKPLVTVSDRIRARAAKAPDHVAFIQGDERLTYGALHAQMDRVAALLQREGVKPRQAIAICAANSIGYATVYLGAIRAGVAVAPLSPAATPQALATMVRDSGARILFADAASRQALQGQAIEAPVVLIEDMELPPPQERREVQPEPDWPLNIIYSSGTTGAPKGIVQSFGMRSVQLQGGSSTLSGYDKDSITLIATPLYSNTTLVSFFSTLGNGGTVVLMAKFDVVNYLELAQKHRVTHTMLVPVQYQRLMAHPSFDTYDLSAFRAKQATSSPFPAALKADVLKRWPGKLIDSYGMTEGGGVCILEAHRYPNKLHTVGKPAPNHDIRLIDDGGREVEPGGVGEVVGHSASMMTGYHGLPELTAAAEWFDASGKRFIRTGDVGRFDEDGFLVLLDRKKDVIISGGFNIYPSDLEAQLLCNPAIAEAAVVGVASTRWGETPVAFVVLREGVQADPRELLDNVNKCVGKMQRLARVEVADELPRGAIGKVLKRELRARFEARNGPLD